MKTTACIAFIFSTVLTSAPASPQAGKSYYCEGKAVAKFDGQTKNTTITAWMKAPTIFHLDQKTGTQAQTVIANGKDIWVKLPGKAEYVHRVQNPQTLTAMNKKLRVIGDDFDNLTQVGATKTGTETVQGSKCDVYSVSKDGMTHTVWVIQGPDKLTKQEKLSGARKAAIAPGQPMTNHTLNRFVTYNWKVGVRMDESLFRVPPGAKITEFTAPAPGQSAPGGLPTRK